MSTKAVAFLLALVFAWAGSIAPATSLASANGDAALTAQVGIAPHAIDPGSVDDLRLDNQPSQVHTEPLADLDGLAQACDATPSPAPVTSCLPRDGTVARLPPYLAGLQRPPSEPHRLA
jgi:hypothetical protein